MYGSMKQRAEAMRAKAAKPMRGWRDVEREFRYQRDPKMRVTLPYVSCLDEDEGDEQRVA